MKKIIAFVCLFLFVGCSFSFYGCKEEIKTLSIVVTLKTKSAEDIGWEEKTYTVTTNNSSNAKHYGTFYYISTDYYQNIELDAMLSPDNEFSTSLISEEKLGEEVLPGQHIFKQKYDGFGEFIIKLNVLDIRPELEINFKCGEFCFYQDVVQGLTEDCYPFLKKYYKQKTHRFAYSYNGGRNDLSFDLSHDGEKVLSVSEKDIYNYIERVEGPEIDEFIKSGRYSFDIVVKSAELPEPFRNKFRDFKASVELIV